MENETLASELLAELKASTRRWFIAFIIMVVLEIATIAGFLIYNCIPYEETTTIEQDSDDNSYNQIIGGDCNGGKAESYKD